TAAGKRIGSGVGGDETMASEGYATAPLSAPGVVLAVTRMPVPVGGTQSKEGALTNVGAVTDASSEGFQIVDGRRSPNRPARVPGTVADAAAGSLDSERVPEAIPDAATSLIRDRVRQQGHRHRQPRVVSKPRTATTTWSCQTTWRMRHPQN